MPVIYKITNPNRKVYIGQSWNYIKRVEVYRNSRCSMQPSIYNSIKKYGWDTHTIEIICILPDDINQEVLNRYETIYHQQYVDCGILTMNIRATGSTGRLNPDSIEKIKNSKKGRKLTEEHKRKISEAGKGRKMSDKTKSALLKANIGRPWSEDQRSKLEGRKFSEEHKSKLSLAKRGKSIIDLLGEEKAKIALEKRIISLTGKHTKSIICVETGVTYSSIVETSKSTGISRTSITNILTGRANKTHSGYSFMYNKNKI